MKLPALLVSDLHLTDTPADEYRWALFPWLINPCAMHKVHTLIVGGDLTDAKDYHSAQLTNRVVRSMLMVAQHVTKMIVLRGNHDYLRDGHTFFEFLNLWPNITFVTRPMDTSAEGEHAVFLPYSKNPVLDWGDVSTPGYHWAFMHQTVKGARSSNGEAMEGTNVPDLSGIGKVYSGDIHVPQTTGCVEYIGSPYPVYFGDAFRGRAVLLKEDGKAQSLRMPTIRRMSIKATSLDDIEAQRLKAGDQVKIELRLPAALAHEWKAQRREVVALKEHTPSEMVVQYVEQESLGADALQVGLEVLDEK